MKKISPMILAVLVLFGLCACGDGEKGGEEYQGLQVGFGRADILPEQNGVQIAGGDASARISDGYRDEVAATCIAITDEAGNVIGQELDLAQSIYIDWGAFINAIINFLLIAIVLFSIVKLYAVGHVAVVTAVF